MESFLLFKVKLSTECGWTWLCSGHFAALPLCLSVMEELVFSGLSCRLCIFNHSSVLLLTATQLWMLYYWCASSHGATNVILTPTAPGLQRPLVWCLQWSHDHRSVSRCLNSHKCWKLPKAVFISFWFLVPVTVVSLFPGLFTWVQHQLFKFPKISCFLKIDKLNAYSAGDVAEQHSRALIKSYSSWCGERMMVPL